MFFSKTASYALRAVIFLAEHQNNGPVLTPVIAKEESIPAPFLLKILGTMSMAGIVESSRGPKGRFILSVNPEALTLKEIVSLFGHKGIGSDCILGYGSCEKTEPCPMHERWSEAQEIFTNFIENTTIADLYGDLPAHKRKSKKIQSR